MNIKAEDLMIGDYIRIKSSQQIVRVASIDVTGICTEAICVKYDDMEPILLKPDILERIGFQEEISHFELNDWDGNVVIYDSWNHTLRIVREYNTVLFIESWTNEDLPLHELQHAVKICKFQKEIKL